MVLFKSFLISILILLTPLTQASRQENTPFFKNSNTDSKEKKKKKIQKQEEQLRMERSLRWQENQMNQQFNRDIHVDPYSPEKQKQEERNRELMNKAEEEFKNGVDF